MRGRDLGMVFQEPLTRLNPLMRISDHFAETLKTHDRSISKSEIERRSLEVLRLMGIPPTRYRAYPHEFSGGMRQRLMIALTLVLRPAVRGRRRADHGARRPGRGADHPDPARPAVQLPHRAAADHPQPRHHRRGVRPGGGDVRRGDRRDRRRARGVLAPQAPVHARAAALDHLAADHGSQLHRRRSAGPRRAAVRLPLPPALPRRDEDLRDPAPHRARARRAAAEPSAGPPTSRTAWRPTSPSPNARRSSGRRSPLPTKPEVRPAVRAEVRHGPRHRGSRRPLPAPGRRAVADAGPEGAQRQGRRRRHRLPQARRGARPGRRVRQRQVHVRPRAARAGAGDARPDHLPLAGPRGATRLRDARRRAAPAAHRPPDGLPGPARRAQPVDDHRGGGRAPAGDPQDRLRQGAPHPGRGRPGARRARPGRAVPLEVPLGPVRRSEAARRHRSGDHPGPRGARRRRAGLHARHERPGQDPPADARPQAGARADVRLHHP